MPAQDLLPRQVLNEAVETAGDEQEKFFTPFYRQWFVPLYRYVFSRIREQERTEDIVQDVFARMYRVARSEGRNVRTPAYLFTLARHALIDHWRKKKELLPDDPTDVFLGVRDESDSPLKRMEREESRDRLRRALAALPEREQELLRFKFFAELPNGEIARILEISEANVRQIQSRAVKRLREHFDTSLIV